MIKVAICDAHPVLRDGVRSALEGAGDFSIVGEAEDGASTLALARATDASVITLDLLMPGVQGVDLIRQIKHQSPSLRILVLTMLSGEILAVRALKAGASGFVTKSSTIADFVAAIRRIGGGGIYVTSEADLLALEASSTLPHQRLSEREFDVLCRIASGQPARQIATILCLSPKTISTYRTRILEKMELPHEAALVRYATRHNLIDEGSHESP